MPWEFHPHLNLASPSIAALIHDGVYRLLSTIVDVMGTGVGGFSVESYLSFHTPRACYHNPCESGACAVEFAFPHPFFFFPTHIYIDSHSLYHNAELSWPCPMLMTSATYALAV